VSDTGSSLPPPPPSATPPPGYVGYEPTLSAAVPLRRVSGLGKAMLILLAISAIGFAGQAAVTPGATDTARDFLADRIDRDQFTEDLAPYTLVNLLTGAVFIALVVLTMIWLYRIAANHRTIGRRLTWAPGWAIGGWFLPPIVLYIIPLLMLRESWQASDPDVPPGDERWRQSPVNPIVYVWWVLYGLVPIVFLVTGLTVQTSAFSGNENDLAEWIDDQEGLLIAQGLVGVAQAIAFFLLVRGLTARHVRLTGESARR
jgi:Domain of unknown function (DUF4328)